MTRTLINTIVLSVAMVAGNANAVFFFFLPGSVTGKITDAITGAEGENCVSSGAKVGDTIRMPTGEVRNIKSLSGTSIRCTKPEFPVRALLEVTPFAPSRQQHSTKVGIDLPSGWVSSPLSDAAKNGGGQLMAINRTTDTGLFLSAVPRKGITDMMTFVMTKRAGQANSLTEPEQSEVVETRASGVRAWRFRVTGKIKSGTKITYLQTILETDEEIVGLNAWTTAAAFDQQRQEMEKLSEGITGFVPPSRSAVDSGVPIRAESAQESQGTIPNKDSPASSAASKVAPALSSTTDKPANVDTGVAQRLRELNALLKEALITSEEFESMRKEILKSMPLSANTLLSSAPSDVPEAGYFITICRYVDSPTIVRVQKGYPCPPTVPQ